MPHYPGDYEDSISRRNRFREHRSVRYFTSGERGEGQVVGAVAEFVTKEVSAASEERERQKGERVC